MSDVYETGPKCPSPTTQKPAPTPTAKPSQQARPKARAKANPDVLGAGPELILDAVPKGRTDKVEAAIATTLRGDSGMAPTLEVWNQGLVQAGERYRAARETTAKWYIEHGRQSPSGNIEHALFTRRKEALGKALSQLADLEGAAAGISSLSGPAFLVLELADRSHTELLTALVGSGRASVDGKKAKIDSDKVRGESRFHLGQTREEEHGDDRTRVMKGSAMKLGQQFAEIGPVVTRAQSSAALLRKRAHKDSANEDKEAVDKSRHALAVCSDIDALLGAVGGFMSFKGEVMKGFDDVSMTQAMLSGGGLLTTFVKWISGGEYETRMKDIENKLELAGLEDDQAESLDIKANLDELKLKLEHFAENASLVGEAMSTHVASRRGDGHRLDKAARGRAELGPDHELHVPIATRLARIESALAMNGESRKVVNALAQKLEDPIAKWKALAIPTHERDFEALRATLPPNIFEVMKGRLEAVDVELGRRAAVLATLEVK